MEEQTRRKTGQKAQMGQTRPWPEQPPARRIPESPLPQGMSPGVAAALKVAVRAWNAGRQVEALQALNGAAFMADAELDRRMVETLWEAVAGVY